jgi:hypothetical protein
MTITAAQIRGQAIDFTTQQLLVKVNAATEVPLDITATQTGLPEKAALLDVAAHTATRANINARALSLPEKAVLLAIAGV